MTQVAERWQSLIGYGPVSAQGNPSRDLAALNAKLEGLLGTVAVDDVAEPYRLLYDTVVGILEEGGRSLLFNRTWHPQRLENVGFVLHCPGVTRRLEEFASRRPPLDWPRALLAEIATIEQDNPWLDPARLPDNPLYVWGAAAMDGLFTDEELALAGTYIRRLIAGSRERFDMGRLSFQAVAVAHLVAQYAPGAAVDRFSALCTEAGFNFEVRDGQGQIVTRYGESGQAAHDMLTAPSPLPFSIRLGPRSIYLADRSQPLDVATEAAGRALYLRYLAEHELSEDQVLAILPTLAADQQAQITALLAAARTQGFEKLVDKIEEIGAQNTNQLLALLSRGLARRLQAADVPAPDRVFAGVFPTNAFNAHVVSRQDFYLVLLNTGAFELLALLAGLFFVEEFGPLRERARQAALFVRDYCAQRTLPPASELAWARPGPEFFAWQIHLVTAAEEFALAHELGHVACGHAGGRILQLARANGTPIAVCAKSRDQELDADQWALAALTRTFGPHDEDRLIGCSGILFFLAAAALVEGVLAKGRASEDGHPPAMERYQTVRYQLAKAGLGPYGILGEDFRRFAGIIADELSLVLPEPDATGLIAGHVAALVADGLQAAATVEFPSFEMKPNKLDWWTRLWRNRMSS